MCRETRETCDRNGKLYEVRFNGQIVGDADDKPTAEFLMRNIAAAFEIFGELTVGAREAVEHTLRSLRLENTCNLYWT